jgi:hypothetical protein
LDAVHREALAVWSLLIPGLSPGSAVWRKRTMFRIASSEPLQSALTATRKELTSWSSSLEMARQLGRRARNLACRSAGVRHGLFHLQDAVGNLSEAFLRLFYGSNLSSGQNVVISAELVLPGKAF